LRHEREIPKTVTAKTNQELQKKKRGKGSPAQKGMANASTEKHKNGKTKTPMKGGKALGAARGGGVKIRKGRELLEQGQQKSTESAKEL